MEENRSCPCTYLETPCQPNCTCKNPFSSSGCHYCCTYGSEEQRKARAITLDKVIKEGILFIEKKEKWNQNKKQAN